jgi:hypothetical protein
MFKQSPWKFYRYTLPQKILSNIAHSFFFI